ncbi:MAG: outer membrane protein [Sphingobacteriales bacterium]|jgi:outer membrane protein
MKLRILTLLLIVPMFGMSQEILTQESALSLALENNYDIIIAKNNQKQAQNNASLMNSGYLPSVTASGNTGLNNSANSFTLTDGTEASLDAATTTSLGGQANVNYVIFDGFGRYYNYQRLKETYSLSELQVRQLIENTMLQVFTQYFEVAKLSESAEIQETSLEVSAKRYKRAQLRQEYGQSTRLEMLNAQVDLQNDSVNYLNITQQLENAKRNLNLLLGRDVNLDFEVEKDVMFDILLDPASAEAQAIERNVQLEQAKKQLAISTLSMKSSKSGGLPKLSFNGGYNYNFTDYGFNPNFQNLTSSGPNAGLTLSWSLFDGGRTRTAVKNSKISIETGLIELKKIEQNVMRDVNNAYSQYKTARFVSETRERSLKTNQLNFARTNDLFEKGQITSIEFRQAQLNLQNAQKNYNEAKYNAKIAEMKVKQLVGELL